MDILDRSLREWINMALVEPRSARMVIYTTPTIKEEVQRVADDMKTTVSNVVHLATMFGLAALVKYWRETGEL
jgi:hypothetical protein